MTGEQHVYDIRSRKDRSGVDLIPDALPFSRLWCGESNAITNAIGLAKPGLNFSAQVSDDPFVIAVAKITTSKNSSFQTI